MSPAQQSNRTTNSLGIKFVQNGPAGIKAKFNEIIAGMDWLRLRTGTDITASVTSDGTVAKLRTLSPYGTISRSTLKPFTLTGFIESETKYISVHTGLVDNIIPKIGSNFISELIGDPPAPPKIEVTGAFGYLWMKCTLDGAGTITNIVIETGASTPSGTALIAYRVLGYFTISSGLFSNVVSFLNTNQSHKRCGGYSTWGSA